MTEERTAEKHTVCLRIRPHHILCLRFLGFEPPGRGDDYDRTSREISETLTSHEDDLIEVWHGVDDLCRYCPELGGNRCISPFGDEDKVRRWDEKVLEGLGLKYGDKLTAGEIRRLVDRKAPLGFCKDRCPWKSICKAFGS